MTDILELIGRLRRLKEAKPMDMILVYTPRYEVYRGYIVFVFSVTMFVCKHFFCQDFSAST